MTTLAEISNRWPIKRLADVFETQLGKMLSAKARSGVNPKPYLRNANIQWERADLSDLYFMDFTEEEQRKFTLKSGDLLMCEGGEIGRTCLWRGELPECFFQKAIHRLRPRSIDAMPEFYIYWMEWAFRFANLYGVTGTQTTIAHLPQEKLEELRIPVPSISEQRAIAHVLQMVQKTKEARQRELALERERKAALMEYVFTHGTRGEKTKQTEMGEIAESWQLKPLHAISAIRYGLGQPPQLDPQGIPMIRATDIKRGRILQSGALRVKREAIPDSRNPYLREGDIIVVRSGAYTGDVALYDGRWETAIAGYDLVVSPFVNDVQPKFLSEYLLGESTQRYFRSQSDRAAQAHLNSQQLGETLIPLPSREEQRTIAELLGAVNAKSDVLERELTNLGELFSALLEELITGRLSTKPLQDATTSHE